MPEVRPFGIDRQLGGLFRKPLQSAPVRASLLTVEKCPPQFARPLIAAWHSRLPRTQQGPWMYAFAAHYEGTVFAVALWHNPSARNLPTDWLELRRMAVAPDAPHCTASFFLAQMARWLRRHRPDIVKLISYQDQQVHTGTIYRAAGWKPEWVCKARVRNRTVPRRGTRRSYRSNLNGEVPDAAAKTRWAWDQSSNRRSTEE